MTTTWGRRTLVTWDWMDGRQAGKRRQEETENEDKKKAPGRRRGQKSLPAPATEKRKKNPGEKKKKRKGRKGISAGSHVSAYAPKEKGRQKGRKEEEKGDLGEKL